MQDHVVFTLHIIEGYMFKPEDAIRVEYVLMSAARITLCTKTPTWQIGQTFGSL